MMEGELVTTRWLAASPDRVFAAFSDERQRDAWWGPHGFTTATLQSDLRAGGRWRLEMRGPDGKSFPMERDVLAVRPPSLVVLRHVQDGHSFDQAMTFTPEHGGTRVTWRMVFPRPEQLEPVREAMRRGNEENLERLAAHLATFNQTVK
jgi:uncharacterized protein YndB with AHSA1/START domain